LWDQLLLPSRAEAVSKYMGVADDKLDDLAITDPYKAVVLDVNDVASLKANPNLPGEFTVTGLVSDVKTGRVTTVVPSTKLRPESGQGSRGASSHTQPDPDRKDWSAMDTDVRAELNA
jgi:hypothetical protein